jgi:uncharacterized alkaline shock family protein YloU
MPVDELVIARAVHAAVSAVPGVAGVSPGRFAETATYGPGERVRGIAVSRAAGALDVEIRLIAVYAEATSLPAVADQVRRAARRAVEALDAGPVRRVDIVIDDLRVEGDR